jgi:hypothetical protein
VVDEPLVEVERLAQDRQPPRHERRARPQPLDESVEPARLGAVHELGLELGEPVAGEDGEPGAGVVLADGQVRGHVERMPSLAQGRGVGAQVEEQVTELRPLAGVQWAGRWSGDGAVRHGR